MVISRTYGDDVVHDFMTLEGNYSGGREGNFKKVSHNCKRLHTFDVFTFCEYIILKHIW